MPVQTTSQRSFRLPDRTLNQLDFLVNKGAGKSGTEAVIIAIEHMYTEYQLTDSVQKLMSLMSATDEGKELLASLCTPESPKVKKQKNNPGLAREIVLE